jgi:hypothetical protein
LTGGTGCFRHITTSGQVMDSEHLLFQIYEDMHSISISLCAIDPTTSDTKCSHLSSVPLYPLVSSNLYDSVDGYRRRTVYALLKQQLDA